VAFPYIIYFIVITLIERVRRADVYVPLNVTSGIVYSRFGGPTIGDYNLQLLQFRELSTTYYIL
jgi:hypothetical protein